MNDRNEPTDALISQAFQRDLRLEPDEIEDSLAAFWTRVRAPEASAPSASTTLPVRAKTPNLKARPARVGSRGGKRTELPVFGTLLVTLTVAFVLYSRYAGQAETAVPLLTGSVLIAFGLAVATVRLTAAFRRSERLAEHFQVPPSRALHALSLQQWLVLMVGAVVVAVGTGALTAAQVLDGKPSGPIGPPGTMEAQPVATLPPSPTPKSPSAAEATPGTGPTLAASGDPTPAPGSTAYLDARLVSDGHSRARPVTFSGVHYPRGISFACSTSTVTYVQWNVAGSSRFEAVAGIDDSTSDAFGVAAELLFYDQDGRQLVPEPATVGLGHPQELKLDLEGVVILRMTCAGRDVKTNKQRSTFAALGDPTAVWK